MMERGRDSGGGTCIDGFNIHHFFKIQNIVFFQHLKMALKI